MPSIPTGPTIAEMTAAYRAGASLEQGFYLRDDVFDADLELLEDRWTWVAHVSEVQGVGDWITAELGAQSAIVVRGEDGQVRAFANVCRHRGSRLCVEAAGQDVMFTCPYHAWTYRLDGGLRSAREMGPGFDPAAFGLKPLPVAVVGGLVFASFGPSPPDLGVAGAAVALAGRLHGFEAARIAARRRYRVAANWKLVLENYHECYHCAPAHPEFARLHALARPNNRAVSSIPDPETGLVDVEAWDPRAGGPETVRIMRSALAEGDLTGSADGRPLAPPMGLAGARWDGQCLFGEVGFLSAFLAYGDHAVIYRFIPRGVADTEMEVVWLVDQAAVEGSDYDVEKLTWLWDVTSLADKRIIERNQAGVASRAYEPGPYSLMEPGTAAFTARYVDELARTDARRRGG